MRDPTRELISLPDTQILDEVMEIVKLNGTRRRHNVPGAAHDGPDGDHHQCQANG